MSLKLSKKMYRILIATIRTLDRTDIKDEKLSEKMIELGQALILLAQLGKEDFDNLDDLDEEGEHE
jgi:hypothetical protein